MYDISWLLFIGASLVVIVAPGQDMVLVMSRGIGQGARAGLATAAGVCAGLLGHSVIATLGLGALLAASDMAYSALKYVGAAYLVYLGGRLLFAGKDGIGARAIAKASIPRLFSEGALSNLSNPKIVLFYFAFLPQFVPASATHPSVLLFTLGVLFALLTFAVKVPVGLFAGALSNWFRAHPNALAWVFRSSGIMLIGLALRLAFDERG